MPYAQNHYPFENKEKFERHFPADFVCEGIDQTRGWFYTLLVLSTALFDEPPFLKNITTVLELEADGRKMSKYERNNTDSKCGIDTLGAAGVRLLPTSPRHSV